MISRYSRRCGTWDCRYYSVRSTWNNSLWYTVSLLYRDPNVPIFHARVFSSTTEQTRLYDINVSTWTEQHGSGDYPFYGLYIVHFSLNVETPVVFIDSEHWVLPWLSVFGVYGTNTPPPVHNSYGLYTSEERIVFYYQGDVFLRGTYDQ